MAEKSYGLKNRALLLTAITALLIASIPILVYSLNSISHNIKTTNNVTEKKQRFGNSLGYFRTDNVSIVSEGEYYTLYKTEHSYVLLADLTKIDTETTTNTETIKNSIFDIPNMPKGVLGYIGYLYSREYYTEKLTLSDSSGILLSEKDIKANDLIRSFVTTDGKVISYITEDGKMISVISEDENEALDIISSYKTV